jgi:ADP-ribose pyrophosphatase YjhB (NUDIX family)
MFTYCPLCAGKNITFDRKNRFLCPDCGFLYYHNTAAASGLVITTKNGILFLIRGSDPARGKLGLPGGFVDPGEGLIEGLRRECREELGWDCGENLALFASFPNVYPYKGIDYNTCDMFFSVDAPELTAQDLVLQTGEIGGCRFIREDEICLDEIAFPSTIQAVKTFLARNRKQTLSQS